MPLVLFKVMPFLLQIDIFYLVIVIPGTCHFCQDYVT